MYQASSGYVYEASLAADAVLRVVADFCRKRGTPSFDGGFSSFDGAKGSNNEWSEAAKAITTTRRCCRGVALLSMVGGLDGRVVLDAIKDASAESEEARAALRAERMRQRRAEEAARRREGWENECKGDQEKFSVASVAAVGSGCCVGSVVSWRGGRVSLLVPWPPWVP